MAENIRNTIYKAVKNEITLIGGKANLITVDNGTYKIYIELVDASDTLMFSGNLMFIPESNAVIDFNINYMSSSISVPVFYKTETNSKYSLVIDCGTGINKVIYKTEIYFGNIDSFNGSTTVNESNKLSLKRKEYTNGFVISDLTGSRSWELVFDELTGSLVLSKQ